MKRRRSSFSKESLRTAWSAVLLANAMLLNSGCGTDFRHQNNYSQAPAGAQRPLTYLSLSQGEGAQFEERMFNEFGAHHHVPVEYLPSGGDAVNNQLELYQEILRHHSSNPDLLMIDTIWPALLASDLVDLRPYLADAITASAPVEIRNNTVNGRLVAIPIVIDFGVLYYRPTLLERYGFQHPPETWNELEYMAKVIQEGERRAGKRDFWGYGWSGGNNESLTCAALEWFLSNSGTNFVEQDGRVRLDIPQNVRALKRAASWIGTISPPGVPLYHESDVENLWRSGQAAFVKGWVNAFGTSDKPVGDDRLSFELASVPAGPNGHFGTLGDMSLAVSKYAANRDLAIKAVQEFTGEQLERQRLMRFGVMPTRLSLFSQPETFRLTLLRNATAQRSLTSLAIRPSTILGKHYDAVTHDISASLSSVFLGRETAEAALAGLQTRIEKAVHSQ